MRLEKTIYKALKYANDDSYILSLMVAKRANELASGAEALVKFDKNRAKLTDVALKEISLGLVAFENFTQE